MGAVLVAVAAVSGCTSKQMEGESAAYLRIDAMQAASGAEPEKFAGHLPSDVQTNGGVIEDLGQVTLRTVMKDPGSVSSPTLPSSTNLITLNRYHVKYVRSDGRNVQGVDVPYEFDGAVSFTASGSGTTGSFPLVRVQAKLEAPLLSLRGLGGAIAISTLAEVTFYGFDQAGREVKVTGTISVNFADWADPKAAGNGEGGSGGGE
jgi:hypothetical protein